MTDACNHRDDRLPATAGPKHRLLGLHSARYLMLNIRIPDILNNGSVLIRKLLLTTTTHPYNPPYNDVAN